MSDETVARKPSLVELGWVAMRIGALAFGGGYVVIGRLKRAFVAERRWIDDAGFVEHLAVASVLPGTNATNLLVMLGYRFARWRGALLAFFCYLAPSAAIMVFFASSYDRLRGVAAITSFFEGLSVAVVGLVASIAVEMAQVAIRRPTDWLFAILAATLLAMEWLGLFWVVLLAAAMGIVVTRAAPTRDPPNDGGPPTIPPPPSHHSVLFAPLSVFGWLAASPVVLLFLVFAKIGIVTFGGGFAMIPAMAHEVQANGWLTDERAFGDAVALGQLTPGPVAISATFIGFRVAGVAGAIAATLGVFGPPALLSILAARSLARVRTSVVVQGALRGLAPTVVGIIAAATYQLWLSTGTTWWHGAIALGTFAIRVARPTSSPLIPLLAGGAATLGLALLASAS